MEPEHCIQEQHQHAGSCDLLEHCLSHHDSCILSALASRFKLSVSALGRSLEEPLLARQQGVEWMSPSLLAGFLPADVSAERDGVVLKQVFGLPLQ